MKRKSKGAHRRLRGNMRSHRASRRKPIGAPRTADELFARSDHFRETWERVTRLVSRMRDEGVSLRRAARDAKVSPQTAIRFAGAALRKLPNGRFVAAASDRMLRVLVIPTADGSREIALRDSRQATEVSHYFTALRRFLHTGDASALQPFRRTRITTVEGERVRLLTDLDAVKRLANAGVLSFESIYART